MKKTIAWILMLTMVLGLWGCGSGTGSLGGGNPMKNELAKSDQEDPEEQAKRLPRLLRAWEYVDTSATMQSQVLLENSQLKVTAESLSSDQQLMTVTLRVENLSDQAFDFAGSIHVNGLLCGYTAEKVTVEPGASQQVPISCYIFYLSGAGIQKVETLKVHFFTTQNYKSQEFVKDLILEGTDPEKADPNAYIEMMRDPEKAKQLGRKVLILRDDLDITAGVFHVDSAAVYLDEIDRLCVDFHVVNTSEKTTPLLLKGPFVNGLTHANNLNNDFYGSIYGGTGRIVGYYAGWTEKLEAAGIHEVGTVDVILSDQHEENNFVLTNGQVMHLEAEGSHPDRPAGEREIYRDDTFVVSASKLVVVERENEYRVYLPLIAQNLQDVKATISVESICIDGNYPHTPGNGVGPEKDYPGFLSLCVEKFYSQEEAEQYVESCQEAELELSLRVDYGDDESAVVRFPLK